MVVDDFFLVLDRLTVELVHNTINRYVHILIVCSRMPLRTFGMYCGFYLMAISLSRVTPHDFVSPDQNVDRYESVSDERIHARCRLISTC